MNICFDGLSSGPVCIGSALAKFNGSDVGMTHIGVGLFIVAAGFGYLVLRKPT